MVFAEKRPRSELLCSIHVIILLEGLMIIRGAHLARFRRAALVSMVKKPM